MVRQKFCNFGKILKFLVKFFAKSIEEEMWFFTRLIFCDQRLIGLNPAFRRSKFQNLIFKNFRFKNFTFNKFLKISLNLFGLSNILGTCRNLYNLIFEHGILISLDLTFFRMDLTSLNMGHDFTKFHDSSRFEIPFWMRAWPHSIF